ncbi:MAG TPA: hypothetical protein VLG36_03235 [Candidatus Chromulinivoraceae bacterium]|nr:hypothetical protein [Candidatus Chromulinivoraceae bacterium]
MRVFITQFQDNIKNNLIVGGALLGVVLLGFYLPIVALIVSIAVSYRLLALILHRAVFDSKFFIFATSIFFYVLVLQAVILISWIFSSNFPLTLCGPLTTVVLLILYFLIKPTIHNQTVDKKISFSLSLKDTISLGVCLLAFIGFVLLPIHYSGGKEPSTIIVLINRVIDDPNHLGMLNDRLQFNRGVILHSSADGHTTSKGVSFYPAGWHSANAVIIKSFSPSIQTGAESLVAYAISKTFWFLFLIFIFTRSIFSLYSIFTKDKLSPNIYAWVGIASLLFTGWFLVDPYLDGFYSFIPQLIIVPLFVLSLVQISFLKKKESSLLLNSLILPALLCMGSALSWLLLFPVFAGATIIYLLDILNKWGAIKTLKGLTTQLPRYLFVLVLALAPILVQIVSSKGTDQSVSLIKGLLLPGPIQTYPPSFYNFIIAGLVVFVIFVLQRSKADKLQPILVYILVILGFTALLYLLQLFSAQANFYYYFKSLNAFSIAASMLCIVGIAFFLNWVQSRSSPSLTFLVVIVIASLAVQFVYTKPLLFTYIKGGRATTSQINEQIFHILSTDYSQSNYNKKDIVIFYPKNNPNLNEVASRLLSSNKPYGECYDAVKGASFSVAPKDFSVAPIVDSCDPTTRITYYVDPDMVSSIQEKITGSNLQNRITLKTID